MIINLSEPEWMIQDGHKWPIAGGKKSQLLAGRLLGPRGQQPEEWEKEWRAGHTPHYYRLIKSLQEFQPGKKNEIARHCLLVGARLDRADLRGLNLDGMNLTNASFRGADLTQASMRGTKLVKVDMSRACLHRADLEGADLSGSDLSMAYCKGTNFKDARVWRTHLRHGIFDSAIFFGADLRMSNVMYASFWGARFDGAKLSGIENVDTANFSRWLEPDSNKQNWSMEPVEGWKECWINPMHTSTFQVNAGRDPRE